MRGRDLPSSKDLAGVIEREDQGLHGDVIAAHLAGVLKAVAEEICVGLQKAVGGFQATVLLDHAKEDCRSVAGLAHDPTVKVVHGFIKAALRRRPSIALTKRIL